MKMKKTMFAVFWIVVLAGVMPTASSTQEEAIPQYDVRRLRMPDTTYEQALAMAQAVKQDFEVEEYAAVIEFLFDNEVGQDWRVQPRHVKNEFMNKLMKMDSCRAWWQEDLLRLLQDKRVNLYMRIYAAQFVAEMAVEVDDPAPYYRALLEASRETDSQMASTAMLSLGRIARKRPEAINRKELKKAVLAKIADENLKPSQRATAVEVCRQAGITEAQPHIAGLVASSTAPHLRKAVQSAQRQLFPNGKRKDFVGE